MIADIATDADRLHSIIENLLHLTRLGSGSAARNSSRRSSIGWSSTPWPRSRRATRIGRSRSTGERPRAIVEGDETYITLLLENLLSNAVKYSPAGSPVEVEITTAGDEVVVEVLDRGMGLDDVDSDPPVRTVLPGGAGSERGQRPRHRPRALPAHRGRARRPGLGATARRRWRGGRVRPADRDGTGRCRRARAASGRLACRGPADPTAD